MRTCKQCGAILSIGRGRRLGLCFSCFKKAKQSKSASPRAKRPASMFPKPITMRTVRFRPPVTIRKTKIWQIEPGVWMADFTFLKRRVRRRYFGDNKKAVTAQINQVRQDIQDGIYRKWGGGEAWRRRNQRQRGLRNAYSTLYRQFVARNFPEIDKLIKAKILQSEIRRSSNV